MTKRILLAEDEPFLRETIQLELREHGVEVDVVSNGMDAIARLGEQLPDLLILDLLMPKMDGYAVLTHLHERGYDVPVVVLSNLSDEMDQAKCQELGVRTFLVKSDMDEDDLWPTIEPYLRG